MAGARPAAAIIVALAVDAAAGQRLALTSKL